MTAADWVKRSRKIGMEKAMAGLRAQELAEQEEQTTAALYDTEHLAGMKVKHDSSQFQEGSSMILTLADKNILDEDGDGLNLNEDELENSDLKMLEKAEKDLKTKRQTTLYDVYDEEQA